MDLYQLNKKVQAIDIESNVIAVLKEKEVEGYIIELNQKQLFDKGQLANEEKLSPYSPAYAKVRKKKGLQTSVKQHYFSGKFYAGFKGYYFKKFAEYHSDVDYAKYLEGGRENFGLTKESRQKLMEKYGRRIAIAIKKSLNK
jgi:hypothetical protein